MTLRQTIDVLIYGDYVYIILGEEIKKERNYDFLIREIDDQVEQLLELKENLLKEKNEKTK